MINKETIISAFDEKLTLLQWLKKIEKALIDGLLKNVKVVKVDEAHVKFVFEFSDGTTQETNEIVLAETDVFTLSALIEGSESVVVDINESNTALEIHLDVDLINRINNSLQLPFARPTEQVLVGVDTTNAENLLKLGEGLEILNDKVKVGGNINLSGDFTANSIVENMSNEYNIIKTLNDVNIIYGGICKNGNKLTIALFCELNATRTDYTNYLANIILPSNIFTKLYPFSLGAVDKILSSFKVELLTDYNTGIDARVLIKDARNNGYIAPILYAFGLTIGTKYLFRIEQTFLLSDNLVQEIGELD